MSLDDVAGIADAVADGLSMATLATFVPDRTYYRKSFARVAAARRRRRALVFVGALFAIAFVVVRMRGEFDATGLAILLGAALLMALVGRAVAFLLADLAYRASSDRLATVTFTLDARRGVRSASASGTATRAWSGVTEVVRFKDGLLLRYGPHAASWLPDSAFATPESASRARALASAHAPKVRDA